MVITIRILMQVLVAATMWILMPSASAALVTLSTSDSPFNSGINNQGWWSDSIAQDPGNDNYLSGFSNQVTHRGFFTFDLTNISGVVNSATISIRLGGQDSQDLIETIGLFDVSTSASLLNTKGQVDITIFNDLGTGTLYGSTDITIGSPMSTILQITLNQSALTDINAQLGGFFSIGSSLTTLDQAQFGEFVFGGTQEFANALTLDVAPVPIPSAVWLFGSGLLGLVGLSRRMKTA